VSAAAKLSYVIFHTPLIIITIIFPDHRSQETEEGAPSQDVSVVLEMDELNQHECMASMTALIGHMQRSGITPRVEQVSGTLQVAHRTLHEAHRV